MERLLIGEPKRREAEPMVKRPTKVVTAMLGAAVAAILSPVGGGTVVRPVADESCHVQRATDIWNPQHNQVLL